MTPKFREKKLIFKCISVFITLFAISGCFEEKKTNKKTIGILQERNTPSLNAMINGFKKQVSYRENVSIYVEIIDGKKNIAENVSKRFTDGRYDIVVGIGTMAAEELSEAAKGTRIPVLVGGVSNTKDIEKKGINVAGISDYVSPSRHFKEFKKLFPNIKTFGVLYNPEENNSKSLVDKMKDQSKEHGVTLFFEKIRRKAEIFNAINILKKNSVQAIFINNDNTSMEFIKEIIEKSKSLSIPVFSGDIESFSLGVDVSVGVDHEELGRRLGIIAEVALDRPDIDSIPIKYPEEIIVKEKISSNHN